MKLSPMLAVAVATVLGSSSAFALSGGPVYDQPTGASQQTGTYQAVLRGRNMMGVVIFGSVAAPTAAAPAGQGLSAIYFEGNSLYGNSFGTASSSSRNVSAIFEASKIRQGEISVTTQLNPRELIIFDVNDVVNGSGAFEAEFDSKTSPNFDGKGSCQISLVKGLDVSPADPYVATEEIPFIVYGLKTSTAAPVFTTLPIVDSPSVVASDVQRAD